MNSENAANSPVPTEAIEAAAAVWLSLRDRGMMPEETTAFLKWLEHDPRHAQIFAELDETWKSLDRLSPTASIASATEPMTGLRAQSRRRAQRWRPAFVALGAAGVFLLGMLVTFALRPPRHTAETELGALRKLELPDGSIAQLNTDSALDVRFAPNERRVRIVRGEVFFNVHKDPNRPFLVAVGPIMVRAVGTAFNVRQRAEAIEVLVTEGRVTVSESAKPKTQTTSTPPIISAGERAVVQVAQAKGLATPLTTNVEPLAAPEIQRTLAWQERRLEFDETELGEVVREFNRYDQRKLVIVDAALAQRRFSGTFRSDGRDSFVRLLETNFGVIVEDRGAEILLHAGRQTQPSATP